MLRRVKTKIVNLAGPLGGYRFARWVTRYQPKILMFHRFAKISGKGRVGRELFEKQIQELTKGFNVVSLTTVIKVLKGEIPRRENMIALTVDDGYADFYHYAYPILKKYDMPATIYVPSEFADGKLWLWPDRLTYVMEKTLCASYTFTLGNQPVPYQLVNEKPYGKLWNELVHYCLSCNDEEKNRFLNQFAMELGVSVPDKPVDDFAAANWDQLSEMAENGIEIGAHTSTHPSLAKVSSENLHYEIFGCKEKLEKKLGVKVTNFCYPNGQSSDYNAEVQKFVADAKFESATVAFMDANPYADIYELRRHAVGGCMYQFKKAIYGVEILGYHVRNIFL